MLCCITNIIDENEKNAHTVNILQAHRESQSVATKMTTEDPLPTASVFIIFMLGQVSDIGVDM